MQKPMHYLLIYLIWLFSAWSEIYLWYLWKRFIFNESPGDSQERQAWYNGVVEVSYNIYLINWVSIRKWACQLSQNKSKENWFIKEYFHENPSELPEKSIVQSECQICDVCHLSSNKSKENLCDLLKKIMYDLFFMNDFS